jgi:hypothetical protein
MKRAKRMIFRMLLAALLLFAQHGAVAHEMAHALSKVPYQAPDSSGGNFHSNLCVFHGDFASVLGAVKSTPPPLLLCGAVFERPAAPLQRHHTTEPVTPASRDPPRA